MSTYTNPFQDRTIVLAGSFSTLDQYYAREVLSQAGAKVREHVNTRTELVIVGTRPGKKLTTAQEMGLEIWDEPRLLDELRDYNNYLQASKPADAFDPLQLAVKGNFSYWHSVTELLGLPVINQIHERVIGEQLAYRQTGYERDGVVWEYEGVESLQALIIDGFDDEQMTAFLDNLPKMPQLRALVIDTDGDLDVSRLLDAFPHLQCLYLRGFYSVEFTLGRHSALRQLVLDVANVKGLETMSFPSLQLLEARADSAEHLTVALEQDHFPLLGHLGLIAETRLVDALLSLPIPKKLVSLGLQYDTLFYDDEGVRRVERDIDTLTSWQGCQQLERLTLKNGGLLVPRILQQQYFPALRYLTLSGVGYEHDITRMASLDFAEGLHLDLSACGVDSATANALISVLSSKPPLGSLNLSYNDIRAKRVLERLAKLPYPVNTAGQQT